MHLQKNRDSGYRPSNPADSRFHDDVAVCIFFEFRIRHEGNSILSRGSSIERYKCVYPEPFNSTPHILMTASSLGFEDRMKGTSFFTES